MTTTTRKPKGISKTIESHVMSLYREGWHIPNIMSIARLDLDTVNTVLTRNKVILDSIQK